MTKRLLFVGASLCIASLSLASNLAYSNFTGSNNLSSYEYTIGDYSWNYNVHKGFCFESEESGLLKEVCVGVRLKGHDKGDKLVVSLWTNSGHKTPGTKLWDRAVEINNTSQGVVRLVAGNNAPTLEEGKKYWITLSSKYGKNEYRWAANGNNIHGKGVYDLRGGTDWSKFDGKEGSMKVEVVPEPATLAVLGLGGLALLRRKRKSS